MKPTKYQQHGATLLVSLIMLVLMTLLAVTSFNLGKSSLQIVGNMQHRNEALAAAQEAIEEAISTTRLFESPQAVFLNPCGAANTRCVDVNGDSQSDVTVALTPAPCIAKVQVVKNAALDLSKPDDAGCTILPPQSFGVAGAVTGDSLCADILMEVRAEATDNLTQAKFVVTEGVAARASTDNAPTSNFCP